MSKFPSYHGELPECLNPLMPRHYLLLFYWVFFNHTALKCYLYQASPELYCSHLSGNILGIWHVPTYRKLYFMVPILSIFISLTLVLPIITLMYWGWWSLDIEFSLVETFIQDVIWVVFSVFIGLLSSLILGSAIGSLMFDIGGAVGIMVTSGVILSSSLGVHFGISSIAAPDWFINTEAGMRLGIPVGLIAGFITIVVFKSKLSTTKTVSGGVVVGFISAILIIVGYGIAFRFDPILGGHDIRYLVSGLAALSRKSVVSSQMAGMTVVIIGSFIGGIATGSIIMTVLSGSFGIAINPLKGSLGIISSLRIIFFPFQVVLALCSKFRGVRHPITWDTLLVLPLPMTTSTLKQIFQKEGRKIWHLFTEISRNQFQRWTIQKALYHYLHNDSRPLRFLYNLFTYPELQEYVVVPMRSQDWSANPPVYHLLLGEIALKFVKTTWDQNFVFVDRLVWWLTYFLRIQTPTPLTHFAGMLYDLLDEKTTALDRFHQPAYPEIYNNLKSYPDGQEIAQTFDTLRVFLSYSALVELSQASELTSQLAFTEPIRPTILTALTRLGDVSKEVQAYQDSTSRANQMAAIGRATDMLKELEQYVLAEVITPEQVILQHIIRQWQALLISAGGELGRTEVVGPVANPYVVGNPVKGDIFVGREDVLRRLEELWRGDGQKPSIVLYGHRRMGKSSILHNLGSRFGQEAVIIDFNMQRVGMVSNTAELLYNLALSIYDGLEANSRSASTSNEFDLKEPDEERFLAHNPTIAFDRFLKQVAQVRQEKRLIIAIDEFELIEQKIEEGKLDPDLLDFCRGLIQSYAWFVMVFAGLHTLQEMARNYWNPLFGSVTGIMVSFLNTAASKRLITQPTVDFSIDYNQDAIAEIIRLTHGQPYLIQLICHSLISRFNQQTFEEGEKRERRFTLADIQAIIQSPEFFRDGDAYFTGIWQQEQGTGRLTQHHVLQTLSKSETGLSSKDLSDQSKLPLEQLQPALDALAHHDVVTETAHVWHFNVELMRRWVMQKEHALSE